MSTPRRVALRSSTTATIREKSTESTTSTTTTTRAPKRPAPGSRPAATATKKRPLKAIDEDVIIISSDSEDDRRAIATRNRDKSLQQENERLKRQVEQLLTQQQDKPDKGKKRARNDEDDDVEVKRLRKKAAKLETENEKLKRDAEASQKEAQQLRGEKSVNVEGLREFFECEICMETLWQPWALSDCGHTFCQSCLISLFNDRKFTCPTCRVAVRHRPTEVYSFKSMIRAVAGPAPPEIDLLADSQHVWDPLWPRNAVQQPQAAAGHRHRHDDFR